MKSIAAAFTFFTRLPFWRLKAFQVPQKYYSRVVYFWPAVGWLTALVMAGTLWLSAQVLPYGIAVLFALLSRLLMTGALHEDGLADFLDGFGGGTSRERILVIMKDSHIGTYGVIGLIFYFALLYLLLFSMPLHLACVVIFAGDPLCKYISSYIIRVLPYARTAETSKNGTVYQRMGWGVFVISTFLGLLPLLFLPDFSYLTAILLPMVVFAALISVMKKKINGYTGDCCGAIFLLCELSFYLGILLTQKIWMFI